MKSEQQKIVIIESNLVYKDYLRNIISEQRHLSFCFQNETTCLDNLDVLDPDLLIVGSLDQEGVIRLLNAMQLLDTTLPAMFITDSAAVHEYVAVNRFKDVAIVSDYDHILELIVTLTKQNHRKPESNNIPPVFIGNCAEMIKIKKALPELSHSRESVLIKGEKGVGKEMLARLIHFNSPERKSLFIKIDALALSHEKTEWRLIDYLQKDPANGDAKTSNDGKTAAGTLYFEEICHLSDEMQAELLLVLEDSIKPSTRFDFDRVPEFRIIAATTENIDEMIARRRFRKDLYYRMNVFNLSLPPLRERREDILLLADFFTYKYCREFKKSYVDLSNDVKKIFLIDAWPGNVGELENAVKRAVNIRNDRKFLSGFYVNKRKRSAVRKNLLGDMISIDDLFNPKDYFKKIDKMSLKEICLDCLADVEKTIMKKALDNTNWNRKKAAGLLNISYKSMLNKIKEYGLA